jgi:hypothetical protein
MTKQQFNIAVAERVMGWERPTLHEHADHGYQYIFKGLWCDGPDFTTDHAAAALVRARVAELGKTKEYIDALNVTTGVDWQLPLAGYRDIWTLLSATPAQTALAAYVAVTGEELEACDE